jgi:glucokinase
VALIVDHEEDLATHVPMVSRILHLLVIDILVVGVAMHRGTLPVRDGESAPSPADLGGRLAATARRAGLGISAAGPLSQLISHSR